MTQTEREDGLRELDRFVAEKIMGFVVERRGESYRYYNDTLAEEYGGTWTSPIPPYSTDISAAHQMETRIKELGLELEYAVALAEIVGRKAGLAAQYNEFDLLHASASERCRAARMVIEQVSRP